MALKFKVGLFLAMVTGLLTFFLSFLSSVRLEQAFYRGIFTAVLFFVLGYIIGMVAESYLKKLLESDEQKGKKIDITDKADSDILMEEAAPGEPSSKTEFKPLNPNDFMNLSPTQK